MYPTLARVHALAIGIMVDLACRSHAGPVPSADLRQRARLSISYFDKIAADLRRHRLVRATRKSGGGNELGRRAGRCAGVPRRTLRGRLRGATIAGSRRRLVRIVS